MLCFLVETRTRCYIILIRSVYNCSRKIWFPLTLKLCLPSKYLLYHRHFVRFHYHHLYGQVYRWCQAYSVELFICGKSRIWSVFQAACLKISCWSRPLWRFRSQKPAERRCRCDPLGGFTLSQWLFLKNSSARLCLCSWFGLSSGLLCQRSLFSQASPGEVLNMYIKFAQCGAGIDGTAELRRKNAKMTNGRNLLRVRGRFSDLLRMSVGVPGRKQNPRFVSHERQNGSPLRLKPTPSSGVGPAEDEGLMEALFFSCQRTDTAGLTCRESWENQDLLVLEHYVLCGSRSIDAAKENTPSLSCNLCF